MYRSPTKASRALAVLVALAVLLAPLAIPTAAAQDALAQARVHYQKGTSLFSSGDYKGAIAEFAAADNIAPAAMLEFNIALCYDRLGDRSEALRRYRVYLREMPNAQNRGSVEGKIRRLEGEIREEQEAARKRREAEAAAAAAAAAAAKPVPVPVPIPDAGNPEDIAIPAPEGAGGAEPTDVYTPGFAEGGDLEDDVAEANYSSNDPELARVAAIDVAAIRNQRGASSAGASGYDSEPLPPSAGAPNGGMAGANMGEPDAKKASKPIYKQWWFWVVAGVGTIILIDFATSDSTSSTDQPLMLGTPMSSGAPASRGLEWRF